MKARLLVTYPSGSIPDGATIPFTPSLIIESGEVGLFTSDWVRNFAGATLDTLTEQEVRRVLRLEDSVVVHLSEIRVLPIDDLYSEGFSYWRQEWWLCEVELLRKGEAFARAS